MSRVCPSRWLLASSTALSAALLAGCGGGAKPAAAPAPRLPHAVGQQLAARADAVAQELGSGDTCRAAAEARTLQQQTIAAINAGRVPARLQEPLQSGVNQLVARIRCIPPAAPPPTRTRVAPVQHHGHGKHEGKGKGKAKGKHKHGDEGGD